MTRLSLIFGRETCSGGGRGGSDGDDIANVYLSLKVVVDEASMVGFDIDV